ncbi:MAG: T9SS type A sorting domain-containing protein, partial [Chitinophagaceae bacterium]|nr:T9SS type A sorting domain-containing protein [Chitinophagaceae bacterium]
VSFMIMSIIKYTITALLLPVCSAATAQQLSIQTINNAGQTRSAAGILLEDAVGGLVAEAVNSTAIMYTPDFLQPEAGTTSSIPTTGNIKSTSGSAGIDNGGGSFLQGSLLLEFTVGEVSSISLQQQGNLLTQGILQPYTSTALPVTGLEFLANRINNREVRLNWKTIQEIDNKGFFIERKKDTDTGFVAISFERTKAVNGSSIFPIEYNYTDANDFTGRTYYRLKQQDIDGRYSFSAIRFVTGESNKSIQLKAWPVPATNTFTVSVTGIEKDIIQVIDLNGRLVKWFVIRAGFPQQINDLKAGVYILNLLTDKNINQRVIIQR